MNGLERELAALSKSVEWPGTPDVAATITARLTEPPRRSHVRPRRLAIAVALAVAALVAALAVPQARTAILDWLGIGGVRIVRVGELPALSPTQDLDALGRRATSAESRTRAGFIFADPPRGAPVPDEVRLEPGLRVSYVWRDGVKVRLIVTQLPGRAGDPRLLKKLAGTSTVVDRFELDGDTAVWLEGGPHVVLFLAPDGRVRADRGWLAGNTLLVDRDGTTVRVEGALDRADAVAIVRAMPALPSSGG